ncbi:MAG: hypothetical protein M3362_00385 [Acidobacteriota bacterium]|nr:hypothetical protein [Acidobacteriota bacterium]
MELSEITEWIKNPDKLIDPRVVDELIFWVSAWKDDKEEELATVDQQVAEKRLQLIERYKSVAKAEAYLEVEPIKIEQKRIELRIKQLSSFRSNLKRRYEILAQKFK